MTDLEATRCAICNTLGGATELYPRNFVPADVASATFSARRLPDRVHYRMVRCDQCGLVRSDPVLPPDVVASLYGSSTFDYEPEVPNLQRTYGRYLRRIEPWSSGKAALLEVGCGNGFALEEALRHGYAAVRGVEPSRDAVERARADIRPNIVCDVMRPGLFEREQFDAVCMFQVFDHVSDPAGLLDECRRVLKPGGCLLFLNHDVAALSARLLGRRSPIIDIEHTFLYSQTTLAGLCRARGFVVRESGRTRNHCSLRHVAHLAPLPPLLKGFALAMLRTTRLERLSIGLPLGNLYLVAQTAPPR